MGVRISPGEQIFRIINVVFLCFLVVVTFYPMFYVLLASISVPSRFVAHRGLLFTPLGLSWASYDAVLKNPNIRVGYINTIIVVAAGTSLSLLLTSLGAYFLSRKGIMLRKFIMMIIVFTMFFSGGIIPFYLTVTRMHLDRSLLALILPVAINTFNLIIMRTAFQSIPPSLEESAKLDGAGHFTILFKIVLPLSVSTVAVIILFYAVQHWNAWFNAMIFLRDRRLFPLQLVLREILVQNDTSGMAAQMNNDTGDTRMVAETIKYAVIMVATVPILVLYPFLQKYFVKGVMVGAIKE
ncbi:ABC transporter permease [Spirochaetia bacterium]|nr:ABC transporter permease [Spirochaetia bacterium]